MGEVDLSRGMCFGDDTNRQVQSSGQMEVGDPGRVANSSLEVVGSAPLVSAFSLGMDETHPHYRGVIGLSQSLPI